MIGLQRGTVKLVPHDPEWKILFQKEKDILSHILGDNVNGIEHIGSTAIKGILSKPIIDIAVGVPDASHITAVKKILEDNGWIWRPKFGNIQNHIVFAKGNDIERSHYLHLMIYGDTLWNERIGFRDYLNTHEEERCEYERLKIRSMELYGDDRILYTKQKDSFVAEIIKKISL